MIPQHLSRYDRDENAGDRCDEDVDSDANVIHDDVLRKERALTSS